MSGGWNFSPGLVPGFLLSAAAPGVALAWPDEDFSRAFMRVLLLCVALSACAAPRWVNLQNPAADLAADRVACDKDAERVVRLNRLGGMAEKQGLQTEAEAVGAHRRCMAARGWRELND